MGAANVINGANRLVIGGAVAAAFGPMAPAAATAIGFSGVGLLNRGLQQIEEGLGEGLFDSGPRNLWGLAPFGTEFDDPDEPTVYEYFDEIADLLQDDSGAGLNQLLEDYLGIQPPDEENGSDGGGAP